MQIWSGKHGKVPALVRARYYTFYNIVHNMNSPHKGRMASIKWRVRGADKWCDMKQQDLPPIYENNKERNTNLERYDPETIRAADAAIEQLQQYGEASENNASDYLHHRQNYMNELQNTFKDTYSTPAGMPIGSDIETTAGTELICPIHKIPFETWETFDNGWALNKLDQMKNIKNNKDSDKKANDEKEDNSTLNNEFSSNKLQPSSVQENENTYDDLNTGQKRAYNSALKPIIDGKQTFLLICGGPGTGKTFTANIIVKQLALQGCHSRACSFMWAAVFQLDVPCPKSSIHNLIAGNHTTVSPKFLQTLGDRRWPKLEEVRLKIGPDCKVIILDEVSMTNTTLFISLDLVLRQAFDKNLPFGGKSIILLGDFCQMLPIDGLSLATVLASFQSSKNDMFRAHDPQSIVSLEAAHLFSRFKCIELTEQMRAADDLVHCATLKRFSLKNKRPPITKRILKDLQRLSPELLKNIQNLKMLKLLYSQIKKEYFLEN